MDTSKALVNPVDPGAHIEQDVPPILHVFLPPMCTSTPHARGATTALKRSSGLDSTDLMRLSLTCRSYHGALWPWIYEVHCGPKLVCKQCSADHTESQKIVLDPGTVLHRRCLLCLWASGELVLNAFKDSTDTRPVRERIVDVRQLWQGLKLEKKGVGEGMMRVWETWSPLNLFELVECYFEGPEHDDDMIETQPGEDDVMIEEKFKICEMNGGGYVKSYKVKEGVVLYDLSGISPMFTDREWKAIGHFTIDDSFD